MIYAIVYGILFFPVIIFYPTKFVHKERLNDGKFVYASNHYSNADPLLYALKFRRKIKFLAKKELFKNKFFSFLLKHCGIIPVDRKNPSVATFKEVLKTFKDGKSLFIFPEGTRNKSGSEQMGDAKEGVVTFASKGGCDIVPMLIYRKPKIFRKNYIIVGEPIKLEGENVAKLTKEELALNLEKYNKAMNALRIEIDEYVSNKKHKKGKN